MNTWKRVLEGVEKRVNKHSFRTWFQPTRLIDSEQGQLRVQVPNPLFREWITSNYQGVLDEVIADLDDGIAGVLFVCDAEVKTDGRRARESVDSAPGAGHGDGANGGGRVSGNGNGALQGHKGIGGRHAGLPLSARYTFDKFVVSSCNQFAHAAAMAVSEKPSNAYNPLYIYGGVGLGKTHLLHAIGNGIQRSNPSFRLLYISSENFMNELINAIRFEKTLEFKDKYRNVDVLLVDDIQFLEGKERTQEEFFHTFNSLYELQKQIVMTSDCPPREISTLEERLRSRFEWGLLADIQPPDLETKMAILNKKAEAEGLELPQDVAMYIASKVKSNIRELEGCLVRTIAYASLTGKPVDIELTTETLQDILNEHAQVVSVEAIQKFVAEYYRLRPSDLRSKNNAKNVALPRHIAMYLAKILTDCSLPEIGRRFGNKHHSTVLHAIRKIEKMRQNDVDFDRLVRSFTESFQ